MPINPEYRRQAEKIVNDVNKRLITPQQYNDRMLALNRKYRIYPILERPGPVRRRVG